MCDIYTNYTNYIGSFIDTDIQTWTFKSRHEYCGILEHVSESQGIEYLFHIRNQFDFIYESNKNKLIELCHKNDEYGKTNKCNFDKFTCCSPSNLRYILHSCLILSHMVNCRLNDIDIVEIGGGYGGLCFFIYNLAPLFNLHIKSYSIFDLQNPMRLQKKYLENLNICNVHFLDLFTFSSLNKNSYLISNYAFSEISMDLQKIYTERVLNPYISHGFLSWNYINVYDFITNKYVTHETEYPLTGEYNKYVRFQPLK